MLTKTKLRQIPSVGKILEHPALKSMKDECPHALMLKAIHDVIDYYKNIILSSGELDEEQLSDIDLSFDKIISEILGRSKEYGRMSLRRTINATGDVLSNGLGRAPMNDHAQKAVTDIIKGYCNLAVDMERDAHIQRLLSILTGAESSLICNNNAAAVMLILNTLCDGKEVIVSRGQLIESDDFRLPDIIAKSGARLIPIGTTNKTHFHDYNDAINESTGAIMSVHKSNYRIAGFSEEVNIVELSRLSRKYNIAFIENIGSGSLIDLSKYGIPEESCASSSIKNSADIVCFSGDKLLGGTQAGVVIGKNKYITKMKDNSLYRVMRTDKMTIAALEATLRLHLDTANITKANYAIYFLLRTADEIESMVETVMKSISSKLSNAADISVSDGYSCCKSFPVKLLTKLIIINPVYIKADIIYKRLQSRIIPVFSILHDDHIILDLRTAFHDDLNEISKALEECCLK